MLLSRPVTVPMAFVHGMLSGVRERGERCDGILAEAGIASELLTEPDARVTAHQYATLFRVLIERRDDEGIGFLSRRLKRGSLALIARSALGAPTLELALRRIARTFRLLQDDVELALVHDAGGTRVALRFLADSAARPCFLHELLLRVFWRLLAWLAGGPLAATRFDFAYPRPAHADHYDRVFPAPAHFDAPVSAFWLDAARLRDPVRRDEAALRAFLADAQTYILLPRRNRDTVSEKVRAYLQQAQPAWPSLETAASALHLSVSTLQRRLTSEATSFQILKDAFRRDIAIVRLNTSQVALATLADELGFADPTAFQRAFKGWTGSAPGAYRRGVCPPAGLRQPLAGSSAQGLD